MLPPWEVAREAYPAVSRCSLDVMISLRALGLRKTLRRSRVLEPMEDFDSEPDRFTQ